jgi:hypothetical protein
MILLQQSVSRQEITEQSTLEKLLKTTIPVIITTILQEYA